jgi:hypothetical protein
MAYNQILLKGQEHAIHYDGIAGESGIYPGCFLKFTSTADQYDLQDESETIGPLLAAIEDALSSGLVTDVYTSGRRMRVAALRSGMVVYARLASGHTVSAIGTALSFAGYEAPGYLGVAEKSSAQLGSGVVAYALETGTGGATTLIKVFIR